MTKRKLSFEAAKACYTHRFTAEHVPAWARRRAPNGRFCAPQYASDREWYDRTVFPGEAAHILGRQHGGACDSRGQTWPLGKWLDAPYQAGRAAA